MIMFTPQSWISVGCGTARDIEYVIEHLKACKTQLYLLDLSPALLEMARARIAAHGLQDQVSVIFICSITLICAST